MTSIFVHDSKGFAPQNASIPHITLVLDHPDQVASLQSPDLKQLIGADDRDSSMIQNIASTLSPGTDAAKRAECYINNEGGLVKVTLIMMPSECSRHNTPSRAHALGAAIKDSKSSKHMLVVLLVSQDSHAFAQICAVGRQFPAFSMKSGESQASQDVHIAVHFKDSSAENAEVVRRAQLAVENIRMAQRL
eukprot:gene42548-51989_t